MGEVVANTASRLVPLLVLIAVVFGSLIVLSLALRYRVRRDVSARPARRLPSAADAAPGDVLSVLGRSFSVLQVETLSAPEGPATWCVLDSDDGPGRTMLLRDLSLAIHFPGCGDAPEGPFPERIERHGRAYERVGEPQQLGQGLRVARYRDEAGRWLAVEERGGEAVLWRGKEIPVEGVRILQE